MPLSLTVLGTPPLRTPSRAGRPPAVCCAAGAPRYGWTRDSVRSPSCSGTRTPRGSRRSGSPICTRTTAPICSPPRTASPTAGSPCPRRSPSTRPTTAPGGSPGSSDGRTPRSLCDALTRLASGADLFLCEADVDAHREGEPRVHLTPEEAGSYAKGASRLLVTHAGPTLTREEATGAGRRGVRRARRERG